MYRFMRGRDVCFCFGVCRVLVVGRDCERELKEKKKKKKNCT